MQNTVSGFLSQSLENLARSEFSCTCGRKHLLETQVRFGAGAALEAGVVLSQAFGSLLKILVVSDAQIYGVCGKSVFDSLTAAGFRCNTRIFDARPLPSVKNAEELKSSLSEDTKLILGIGGGTVCDLVKYAAAKFRIPCAHIAVSPSQAGYFAPTASLIAGGFSESFVVKPPQVLICDTELCAGASAQAFAAGFGEILSSALSLFDRQFSDVIKGEEFCKETADVCKNLIDKALDAAEGVLRKDAGAASALSECVFRLSALAQISGSTRLLNSSPQQCANTLSLLKLNTSVCRLYGEHAFLSARILVKLYCEFLKKPDFHSLPPPDNVSRLEKIAAVFQTGEAAAAQKISPLLSAGEYELLCHKLTEYRDDFAVYAESLDKLYNKAAKIFARLYMDAGFWINRYLTEDEVRLMLCLTPDMSSKYTFLNFLKDIGYLEQYL